MAKLTQQDKDRILELWRAARERLGRIADDAAEYFGQPEHDQDLLDAMKEALDEAHTLKMQSLHHFPHYETAPGAPPILAPFLYDLLRRIRFLVVGVTAPRLVAQRDREQLRQEIGDIVSAIEAVVAGAWADPECQAKWEHLRDSLRSLDAIIRQIDFESGLPHSPARHVARTFAENVAHAAKEAVACMGATFPYLDLIREVGWIDLELWALGIELTSLVEPIFDLTGDPRDIRDFAFRLDEKFTELESNLETAPVESQ